MFSPARHRTPCCTPPCCTPPCSTAMPSPARCPAPCSRAPSLTPLCTMPLLCLHLSPVDFIPPCTISILDKKPQPIPRPTSLSILLPHLCLASPLHSLCFGQQQVATLALEREARARPRHGRVKAAAAPAPSSPPLLSHPLLLDQNLTPPRLLVPRLNRSLMRSRRNVTSVSFQRRRTRTSPARSSPLTGRPRPPQPPHTLVVDPQPPHGEIPAARGLPFMFPVCPRVGRMETHPSR